MMNLTLKRFYQAVDLDHPDQVTYYLVLVTDSGREVLLPVQKETTEALVRMLYAGESEKQAEEKFETTDEDWNGEAQGQGETEPGAGEVEEVEEQESSEFGGDSEEDLDDMEPGILAVSPEIMRKAMAAQRARQTVPESEDEVPSL